MCGTSEQCGQKRESNNQLCLALSYIAIRYRISGIECACQKNARLQVFYRMRKVFMHIEIAYLLYCIV